LQKILIVEDSKTINNTLQKALSSKDRVAQQAFTLKDAYQLIKQESFDFIILDLHLPDGDGDEFIKNIPTQNRPKIIVLTVDFEKQLREELFHLGILDYIVKDKNILLSIKDIIAILNRFENNLQGNVLVVDDSKFICKQITSILTPRNYKVDIAHTANNGLDMIGLYNYDIIILDIELPDINGVEVLENIKANPQRFMTPVIVLSGNHDPELIRNTLKLGANDFIRKPYIIEEFLLKIDMLIDNVKKEKKIVSQEKKLSDFVKTLQMKIDKEVEKNDQQQLALFAQSRHAQMGEMISMIAHQWRQPLNSLSVHIQLVINKYKNNNLNDKIVDKFEKQSLKQIDYMSTTIDLFRDFFKKDSNKVQYNLSDMLNDTLNIMGSTLKHENINFNIICDKDIILNGYPKELSQALLNIINNSKDAFNTNHISNKTITIDVKKDSNISIDIEDNAGGIPKDIILNIFNPYFSTKLEKNGTGLGLYMTKMIIEEKCKGSIKVASEDDTTTFRIDLDD